MLLLYLYIYDSVIEKYYKCLLIFNLKYMYLQIICCLLILFLYAYNIIIGGHPNVFFSSSSSSSSFSSSSSSSSYTVISHSSLLSHFNTLPSLSHFLKKSLHFHLPCTRCNIVYHALTHSREKKMYFFFLDFSLVLSYDHLFHSSLSLFLSLSLSFSLSLSMQQ